MEKLRENQFLPMPTDPRKLPAGSTETAQKAEHGPQHIPAMMTFSLSDFPGQKNIDLESCNSVSEIIQMFQNGKITIFEK